MRSRTIHKLQSLALLLAVFAAWEGVVRIFAISPFVIPAPSAVIVRLYEMVTTGEVWPHFVATLTSVLTGLAAGGIAGLVVGSAISLMPAVERLVYPYVVAMQTVPKIAIAPLFVMWFGYGLTSKIVITALLCFFPILVSVVSGFQSVDKNQLEMMRAFGSTPMQTLFRLRIPSALVLIFAGFEIASVLAVIGAVVGEFVGAQVGLGYLITSLNFNLDVAGMFAVLLCLAAIGLSLHSVVKFARKRMIFWLRSDPAPILG
ncbi:ABC transporter permease [Rhodopseudomonas sp. HC1]|uniref:ABC transporter permease n=1 Tax=Rhodopseudomonas infernalis TaxID=2897386 RepID=UPI001EE83412|nr:ABC transporter permease [Rhodopseudomonas infernalis]MCG6204223.1 ABC transporter permease [Rhodopseudomonas infernalis]